MHCPSCGAEGLVRDVRDLEFTHQGTTICISAVEGDYCNSCHEFIPDRKDGDRFSKAAVELVKGINPTNQKFSR